MQRTFGKSALGGMGAGSAGCLLLPEADIPAHVMGAVNYLA
jgi:hypothetical protein